MELLSTVHWVSTQEKAATVEDAVTKIHGWSSRKRMFEPRHIGLAWERFHEAGWLL
jgi:hypothetical protein